MADEQNTSVPTTQQPVAVQMPQSVPTLYINAWAIQLGQTDITLHLGLNPADSPSHGIEPVVSVVLTHGLFQRLALSLGQNAAVISKLYGGNAPGIYDLTAEKLRAATQAVAEDQAAFNDRMGALDKGEKEAQDDF